MTTDYRALCAQLADELERCRPLAEVPDCLQRARAALAAEPDHIPDARKMVGHPAPVPVSERLPGPEDCDGEGRCWWGFEETDDYEASWTLRKMIGLPFDDTHWLPATALPLPQGEVQP